MRSLPKWPAMTNMRLTKLPGKINLSTLMCAKEFDVAFFDIAEKTSLREDRFDVPGQILDRFFKRVNAVLQVIFFFQEPVGSLGRANEFMHEEKVVGAAVSFFFSPEKFQALLKLWQ